MLGRGYTVRGRCCPVEARLQHPCAIYVSTPGCWPAWLFVCPPSGLLCHEILFHGALDPWALRAQQLFPAISWVDLATTPITCSQFAAHPEWVCFLLPASWDQLELIPRVWFTCRRFLGLGMFTPLPHSIRLSHLDTGGVIDGHWTISSSQPFCTDSTIFPSLAHGGRCLRHIINQAAATPFAAAVVAPKADEKDAVTSMVLNWNRPIPKGCIDWLVLCPSVFVATGWVKRHLTCSEKMAAYDVPLQACPTNVAIREDDQAPRTHSTTIDYPSWRCPFTQTPPLKILQRALECWLPHDLPVQYDVREAEQGAAGVPAISMYEQLEEELEQQEEYRVSTKADDAETPVDLWNERIWYRCQDAGGRRLVFLGRFSGRCPLDSIRRFLLCRWRRNVTSGLLAFLREEHGTDWRVKGLQSHPDVLVGRKCLTHCAGADWWEWRLGSTLFFWRWPDALRRDVRDGHPIWVKGTLPSYKRPQRREPDAE